MTGDGVPDVVVSDSIAVRAYSGKTWSRLWSYGPYGQAIAGAGDADHDGFAGVVMPDASGVVLLSGRQGQPIRSWPIGAQAVAGATTSIGTGTPMSSQCRMVRAFSGKTGLLVASVQGTTQFQTVAIVGDHDRDGIPEIAVGDPSGSGMVRLMTIVPQPLATDQEDLSLTTGGIQAFSLLSQIMANRIFVFLGTASGTRPGYKFDDALIPLNNDVYHQITMANPNSLISPSVGILDFQGKASSRFVLPPNMPASLAGLVLHHAFVTLSLPPRVAFASNAAVVRLGKEAVAARSRPRGLRDLHRDAQEPTACGGRRSPERSRAPRT